MVVLLYGCIVVNGCNKSDFCDALYRKTPEKLSEVNKLSTYSGQYLSRR
ncbi:hypothetical protein EFER_1628 [Escherichia fergusonii ATCC 35469]|uniref:Uncharacterized protein n=1 Tax=Escherichia fergusonii (strain ATCC 35469 / DSM 13698 / CCUG 18766 / IAM 14443 / JCM 21226 / LMG 7866 / NBRC 102419 / NCTC 12128 / CDC 0568-73) TaxID=585054 RepID=B7LRV2_ESCF3|nr:hypothetical protein EFER_1628 [Escherichia fergusonii ATCC 35469]